MAKNPSKRSPRRVRSARKPSRAAAPVPHLHIRMYRLGVGDCFLVTLPQPDDKPFRMLIDCGVHMAQSGGSARILDVARDIVTETGGKLDVIVGTHEHWDHISGFYQARNEFEGRLQADVVWLAWTEDDTDPLAQKVAIKKKRYQSLAALRAVSGQIAFAGDNDPLAKRLDGLLGFYGDGGGTKLKKCGDAMLALANDKRRYLKPGEPPIEIRENAARFFVLGPPRDEKLIAKDAPSRANSEVYEFGRHVAMAQNLEDALSAGNAPFDGGYAIPLEASAGLDFFHRHYWADFVTDEAGGKAISQKWRRVDTSWLDIASDLALNLDADTNNTSLVLALELGPRDIGGPVILFAADAQVGNWLGWHTVSWELEGRTVTASDLLHRTMIYKVGHHASHNATLKELGLEQMVNLELALIPTDDQTSKDVGWGTLPWPPLLRALDEKARKRVVRTDRENGACNGPVAVTKSDLYYDILVTS
ncbi:MAG: hypothetical protein EP335_09145 [Alphaproteobacteria bacterium]|nr:MAG: hypothetical protein EP335_09145 [Alphaproteobacteria bacterium]